MQDKQARRRRAGIALALLVGSPWSLATAQSDPQALLAAGKKQFGFRCAACHTLSAAAPPLFGPHLEGIVDRRAGTVPGFAYSDPDLRGQTFVWDAAYFEEWLQHPQRKYPAMCVPFRGLASEEARKALFLFLKNPAGA